VNTFAAKFALIACCLSVGACATTRPATASSKPPLDITLARADGTQIELAALSGRPTLLFLFATYDEASQFALDPLVRFLELDKRAQVIGIALQPNAKAFLNLYKKSLAVPFPLYFDPDNKLLQGQTTFGRVTAVPTFIALDPEGRVRQSFLGVATAEQLRTLVDSAAH
jgi:peroxiredoxin